MHAIASRLLTTEMAIRIIPALLDFSHIHIPVAAMADGENIAARSSIARSLHITEVTRMLMMKVYTH